MRWYFRKTFIVLCILQIVRCIQNQEPVQGVELTDTLASVVLDAKDEINTVDAELDFLSELEAEASGEGLTSILPTESPESSTATQNDDDQEVTTVKNCLDNCASDSSSKCVCDCNTGAILGPLGINQCAEINEDETTTIRSIDEITSSAANEVIVTTKSPEKQTRICQMIGETIENDNNCHSYFICSPAAEGFEQKEQNCPLGTAYNAKLRRCARDLVSCKDDEPPCLRSGTFEDGNNNSSYIWCVPDMTGHVMHKYRVRCASYEVFLPALGTCFIDVDKIKNGKPNFYQQHDIDMIKAELEEFKIMEKAQLKEQKLKLKFEKKLQKALIKKAIKDAKERAKLEGKDSKEMESFVCIQEGNFKSPLGPNFYNSCITKKGKFKAITMLCMTGTKFDELSGVCA